MRFLPKSFLSLDNLIIFTIIIVVFLIILSSLFARRVKFIPTPIQFILEIIEVFWFKSLIQQAGKNAGFFSPIIISVFFLVLISNIVGLLNWSYTITSHIILTLFLAFSFNAAFIIYGIAKKQTRFITSFVPSGLSIYMQILVGTIEFFSYLLRTFSLSIRLFANMLAGHILLGIACVSLFLVIKYSLIVTGFVMMLTLAVLILEISIAFIQAYVFSILLCVYLNDVLNDTH